MIIFVRFVGGQKEALMKSIFIVMLGFVFLLPCAYCEEKILWNEVYSRAESFYEQGQYSEALAAAQEALEIAEEEFGSNHLNTAASLDMLAVLYKEQGRDKEAIPIYERIVEIKEGLLGEDNPDVASAYKSLAALYKNNGDYYEADLFYNKALAVFEGNVETYKAECVNILENLSEMYMTMRNIDAAEEFKKRIESIR